MGPRLFGSQRADFERMRRCFSAAALFVTLAVCQAQTRMMMTTVVPSTYFNDQTPYGELTLGNDGYLYGTTYTGGAFGKGSYFKTTLDGAITFVAFDGTNGTMPFRAPLQAADGNFYGAATAGGAMDAGTVYQIDTNGAMHVVYSFDGTNGSEPGSLVLARNGDLYGFTFNGGIGFDGTPSSGDGVIFKLTTNGDFTRLASFTETNLYPKNIIDAGGGILYGTTESGGDYGFGTVFRMNPDGQLVTLVSFDGTNGVCPTSLIMGSDGLLYGTTALGGNGFTGNKNGGGSVFKVSTNGSLTTLRFFSGNDGNWPWGQLIEVTNGLFYGVTYMGGKNGEGTVFQITSGGQFASILQCDARWERGGLPRTGLTKGSDGNYYGITSAPFYEVNCLRPVEAPVLQYKLENGQITLSWKVLGGLWYWLSYKTNLDEPVWHPTGTMPTDTETNGIQSHTEPIDPSAPRFYKVSINIPEHWW